MKAQAAKLFDQIKTLATDPHNIFYFILGILSNFNDGVEKIYQKIKDFISEIDPCIDTLKTAYGAFAAIPVDQQQISGPLKSVEEAFNKTNGKKQYCENTKSQIDQNYEKAVAEHIKHQGLLGETYNLMAPNILKQFTTKILTTMSSDWNYCMFIRNGECPIMQKEIKRIYKNPFTYETQCLYFHKLDCGNFVPETNGLWEFIKKADKLYDFIETAGKCIYNIVNGVNGKSADKLQKFGNLLKEIFPRDKLIKDAMAAAIGVVLNIATLGAWGGLKAGYYLLDLAEKIEKYYKDQLGDAAFNIGVLMGRGILIAKSFITGRRRKFRKN